jgi:hypothetical protein
MSKTTHVLIVTALGALAGSAHAADKGFYLGAGIGQANLAEDFDDLDDVDDFDFDSDDTGLKAFGGFRFNDWIGVEGAYIDYGSPSEVFDDSDVDLDASALAGYVVGYLPITTFDLFAKVGLASWDVDYDLEDLNLFDDDGTDLAWGVGGQFRLGSAAFRLEYEDFEFGDDANLISVGFSWTFF